MGKFIFDLAEQMGGQAAAGAMGMVLGGINDKRQLKQQEKLQRLQIAGNKELLAAQAAKELQMWKDTSYPAQMEMLKKAGLNAGLIYGMGGAGGQTTGGAGGGVTGAAATQAGGGKFGISLQMGMMAAQKKLLEAQANNLDANTKKTQGVDTDKTKTEIDNIIANTTSEKAKQGLMEIQTNIAMVEEHIKTMTQNAAVAEVFTRLRSATEILQKLTNEREISDQTKDETIKLVEQDLIEKYARIQLTRAQTNLSKQQADNISKQLALAYDQLKNEQEKTKIAEKLQQFQTSFGNQASQILQTLLGIGRR